LKKGLLLENSWEIPPSPPFVKGGMERREGKSWNHHNN
jgi:hypothetical protein